MLRYWRTETKFVSLKVLSISFIHQMLNYQHEEMIVCKQIKKCEKSNCFRFNIIS